MAITNAETGTMSGQRVGVYGLIGLAVVVVVVVLIALLNRPPQMGADEDTFQTVDALYTAVRNQDEKRLTECAGRLSGYRDAGKLPTAAADELDAIIGQARGGGWDAATRRLYDFMLAQRREGADGHQHDHKPKSKPTAPTRAKR